MQRWTWNFPQQQSTLPTLLERDFFGSKASYLKSTDASSRTSKLRAVGHSSASCGRPQVAEVKTTERSCGVAVRARGRPHRVQQTRSVRFGSSGVSFTLNDPLIEHDEGDAAATLLSTNDKTSSVTNANCRGDRGGRNQGGQKSVHIVRRCSRPTLQLRYEKGALTSQVSSTHQWLKFLGRVNKRPYC